MMKKLRVLGLVIAMIGAVSGCIIAPAPPPGPPPGVVVPPGVVYVEPAYPMPAPGYVWAYHPGFGWGWRHPNYGWHRGWR
jgi:hypothetical protein